MSEKERTLSRARTAARTYLSLRGDLEEARQDMVQAIYDAATNGNGQQEIADECSFPEESPDMVFSRSRIQQFIRERSKAAAA